MYAPAHFLIAAILFSFLWFQCGDLHRKHCPGQSRPCRLANYLKSHADQVCMHKKPQGVVL